MAKVVISLKKWSPVEEVRSAYQPAVKVPSVLAANKLGTRTKQEFKDECDINKIMRKFEKTGVLPDMIKADPQYGDYSEPIMYQEALNLTIKAGEQFAALSAKVRERFGNDPARFLEFASQESNLEEMGKMGLLKPEALERVRQQILAAKPSPADAEAAAGMQVGKKTRSKKGSDDAEE